MLLKSLGKLKTQAILMMLLGLLLMALSFGCAQKSIYTGKVYEGDSATQSILSSDTDTVKCSDPKFDHFFCLSEDDLKSLMSGFMENKCH